MARIRTVKPELFKHEALFDAEEATGLPLRLAFIGLLCCADREGRFKWRPRTLKADVFPHDDLDFADVLDALHAAGIIAKYVVDGVEYGYIPTFSKHQTINQREAQSALPAPLEGENMCVHVHAPVMHENARGEGKGKERKGKEGKEKSTVDENADSRAAITAVFEHWQTAMRKPRALLDDKRRALIRKALAHYSPADLCKAIDGCAASAWHMGDNDRRTPFNGLDLILRNAEKIDGFMALADQPQRPRTPTREEQRADTLAQLTGRATTQGGGDDPFTIDA